MASSLILPDVAGQESLPLVFPNPAKDGEFIGFPNCSGNFESIFKGREEGIALYGLMNLCKKNFVTKIESLPIYLRAACNPNSFFGSQVLKFFDVVDAVHTGNLLFLSAYQIGVATREWLANTFVGLAPHNQDVPHGLFFKPSEFFR